MFASWNSSKIPFSTTDSLATAVLFDIDNTCLDGSVDDESRIVRRGRWKNSFEIDVTVCGSCLVGRLHPVYVRRVSKTFVRRVKIKQP